MTKQFEDLSAAALANLDTELAHIAETEQLSPEQNARIAARAMEKAGFAEPAQQPVIRRRKRTRIFGALIAAALSVTVLAVGVGGYLRYNKKVLDKTFGVLGTARLEEMNLTEPLKYTNGTVNASVDAVLCDGHRALVLTTYSAADPAQDIDWIYQLYNYHEKGMGENTFRSAYPAVLSNQNVDGQCLVTMLLTFPDEPAGDTLTIVYEKAATDFPENGGNNLDLYESPEFIGSHVPYFCDLTDGLEISIPLDVNIPVLTLKSATDETVQLSGFELIGTSQSQIMAGGGEFTICRSDGSRLTASIPRADENAAQYRVQIDGVKMKYSDPTTYIGFLDISDVSAVEIGGTMYTRVG